MIKAGKTQTIQTGTAKRNLERLVTIAVVALFSASCSDGFRAVLNTLPNELLSPQQEAQNSNAFRVIFQQSHFYSLTEPNDNSCAGDIRNYFEVTALNASQEPMMFPINDSLETETVKPSWIRGVSVDLTDTNTPSSANNAFGCSLGNGVAAPPVANCATFDFGAIEGVQTTLGGSILLLSGLKGQNFASNPAVTSDTVSCGPVVDPDTLSGTEGEPGLNVCREEHFALAIDSLPPSAATNPPSSIAPGLTSATEPISSIIPLQYDEDDVVPQGGAGVSTTYLPEVDKVLYFAGSKDADPSDVLSTGHDVYDTWIFDVAERRWSPQATNIITLNSIFTQADCTPDPCDSVALLPKTVGPRLKAASIAAPGFAIREPSNNGTGAPSAPLRDTVDRILHVGGVNNIDGQTGYEYTPNISKFNPTFGPEWIDIGNGQTGAVTQWLDSFHTQRMTNGEPTSHIQYLASGNLAGLFSGALHYQANGQIGFIWALGGMDSTLFEIPDTEALNNSGNSVVTDRSGPNNLAASYAALANYSLDDGLPDIDEGVNQFPIQWGAIGDTGAPNVLPNFVGGMLLQGFNKNVNEFVHFGGVNCRDYHIDSPAAGCPNGPTTGIAFNPLTRYYRLGAGGPPANVTEVAAIADIQRAGMAAARGLDGNGNPIIIAFGGTLNATGTPGQSVVHILWNNGGTPAWDTRAALTPTPLSVIDGAMVYSHVTRKFYLFGGLRPVPAEQYLNDTWELTVSGPCTGPGTCTLAWRQLNVPDGLTCYPACLDGPQGRRGHSFVEVNYANTDPRSEYETCPAGAPCSFGIFMEGGTRDDSSVLADRWMFDPTANGGLGHWQRVNDFPPRNSAAVAALSYFIPEANKTINRAIVFGGQSGLHSPSEGQPGNSYIPPVFGDTVMFDFDNNLWHRVELLGQGVPGYNFAADTRPQYQARQTFNSTDVDPNRTLLRYNAPPPLAGAVMITRLFQGPTLGQNEPNPLRIPEVFLFGGRDNEGRYHRLDNVYKFCLGTTGETPIAVANDGTCDSFHSLSNPDAQAPVDQPVGRWLRKNPPVNTDAGGINPGNFGFYQGAGVYDTFRDRIVLYGGLSPLAGSNFITQTGGAQRTALSQVIEYTPPSQSLQPNTPAGITNETALEALHGTYRQVPVCPGFPIPVGRYAHSMALDSVNQQIIVIGGKNASGIPLTQTWLDDGDPTGLQIPEVWALKRDDTNDCYTWRNITTFGNLVEEENPSIVNSGLSYFDAVYIQGSGYNSSFYTLFDSECAEVGPVASDDVTINKQLAGGVYFDLVREEIEENKLLLNLTFIPLGDTNQGPTGAALLSTDKAFFKVHLMRVDDQDEFLNAVFQPRHLQYADDNRYPKIVDTLSILAPPDGQLRQEQIMIPLVNEDINRIRIERVTGTGILIDASLHRMGRGNQ